MNISPNASAVLRHARHRGMTLVEMMLVMAVFLVIISGIVGVQVFAMRCYTLAATKLSATQDARETLNFIRDQVRSAKRVYVGNFTNGTGFSLIPAGNLQQGNAIAIATTNAVTTNYMVYYVDLTQPTNILYSISNNLTSTKTVMASYVTNYYAFFAEDYQGNVQLNYINNPVFHIDLQFDKWEYPIGFVGTNALNAYDFYKLNARVMRRSKD